MDQAVLVQPYFTLFVIADEHLLVRIRVEVALTCAMLFDFLVERIS